MDTEFKTWLFTKKFSTRENVRSPADIDKHLESISETDANALSDIYNGGRVSSLWDTYVRYNMSGFDREFVDRYLENIRDGMPWRIVHGIDTMLIESFPNGMERTSVDWLVNLVQCRNIMYSERDLPWVTCLVKCAPQNGP